MTLRADSPPDSPRTTGRMAHRELGPIDVADQVVLVLADDLIWSTRLSAGVRAAGARPIVVRSQAFAAAAFGAADRAIVDLTARAYDGVAQVAVARRRCCPVLAVGQHDDADLRRRALAAGAERVHPYRLLFEAGPRGARALAVRRLGGS